MTPHGTPNGYNYHKCRCEECKAAMAKYAKALRFRPGQREKDLKRQQRYRATKEGRVIHLKANKKYSQTKRGKATMRRANKKYNLSNLGKRTRSAYLASESGRAALYRGNQKWRHANPEKVRAHNAVTKAIKSGLLVRPNICEHCDASIFTEASHTDYEKTLDVEWLCHGCHLEKDGINL